MIGPTDGPAGQPLALAERRTIALERVLEAARRLVRLGATRGTPDPHEVSLAVAALDGRLREVDDLDRAISRPVNVGPGRPRLRGAVPVPRRGG